MIVQSLNPTVIPSIPQSTINTLTREIETRGMSGTGMGDCGCGCDGAPGGCRDGLSGLLDDVAPFTSLAIHLAAAWVAWNVFRMVFTQKNADGDNRYRVRRKAVQAARKTGADAVAKAKAQNSLFF